MWTTKTVRVEAAFTTNCYFLAFKKKNKNRQDQAANATEPQAHRTEFNHRSI